MLKVNIGFCRKVSRDFQSTGFSVNLEGEVIAALDDPEMVIEKIREFQDLAEEALNQQIDRYEGESAIASRDEEPADRSNNFNRRIQQHRTAPAINHPGNGNGHQPDASSPPATNKQIQFLLTLGKRQGLSKQQLENQIAGIIGRNCDVYGLTKREAGLILNQLANERNGFSRPS